MKQHNRLPRTLIVGVSLIAALLVAAGPSGAQTKPPGATVPLKVRLDWLAGSTHVAFHLATEKGWFAARGLDVQIEDGTGSGVTVQVVGGGGVDIGHASLAVMAVARDKGLRLKSVAGIFRRGDLGVIVPRDSNIRTPRDLEGKRLVYSPGSVEAPFLDSFFKGANADIQKVNLIAVDPAAKATTYLAGRGDAFATLVAQYPPLFENQRPSRYLLFADFGLQMPSLGLFVREETLRTRRDAVCAFVDVVLKSWQYILDGHDDEGIDALLKQRPQAKLPDRKIILAQSKEEQRFFHTAATKGRPLGWQAEEDWASGLRVMGEAGVVKKGLQPSDFYTNECIAAK